ncbi:MAG: hypothetical protein SF066_22080 [Thermoanaerobaculia bacterium]|nr:hypothetical protein [Thermoanaerobaculia bacterium]
MKISRSSLPRHPVVYLVLLVMVGIASLQSAGQVRRLELGRWPPRIRPPALAAGGSEVHGYVVADLANLDFNLPDPVFVPDVTVYLARTPSGRPAGPAVQSDRRGFFVLPEHRPGAYFLCLEKVGFERSCRLPVSVGSATTYLKLVSLFPRRGTVVGRASFKGAGACGYEAKAWGVDFATWVALDPRGAGKPEDFAVRADVNGFYVLGGVPDGRFEVVADCEKSHDQNLVAVNSGRGQSNFAFGNRAPRAVKMVARQGGQALRLVAPGATVEVTAEATDDETTDFRWDVSDGTLSAKTGPSVLWTLPSAPGVYSVYTLARDGRGGVTTSRRDVSTHPGHFFSGKVVDGSLAIEEARVTINGRSSATNKAGAFFERIDEDTSRWVVTIEKEGYRTFTRVYDAPVINGIFRLAVAERFDFDAAAGTSLRERQDCRRPRDDPQGASGTKRLRAPLGSSPCGATLEIPPGALIDGRGRRASGPVRAYVGSVDLRDPDSGFPGEYAGMNASAREVGLNSLGAVDIKIVSATGERLRLDPTIGAEVGIPVDDLQLKMPGMPTSPPATIPLWFLDEKSGLWQEEGTAVLSGGRYVARVKHFSVINADLEFTNPACLRVITDTARLPLPYQLRMSVPAVAPVKIKTETIADALSVLVRLPAATSVKLEVIDSAGHTIQLATRTVVTGATSAPAFPAYPYASCTSEVEMTLDVPSNGGLLAYLGSTAEDADTYYSKIDPTTAAGLGTVTSAGTTVTGTGTTFTTFLKAGHLVRAATQVRLIQTVTSDTSLVTESPFNPALAAGTSFERVGAKATLDDWKAANEFDGVGEHDAVYLNAGDLGLGRWMHMKKKANGEIAYYVSNYGVPPAFGSADLAAAAKLNNDPSLGLIATVAMEFSPTNGGGSYTKFYVYDKFGARINKADLDGNGNKYIPMLCSICHGGNSSGTGDSKGNLEARFIPFDPPSFKYSGLGAAFTQAAQEGEFKELNRQIRDATDETPAVRELIEGWYGGAALPLANHFSNFVPTPWTAPVDKSALYSSVIKPSCRACHTTREGTISWATWDPSGVKGYGAFIKSLVCQSRVMPQATVTFQNFWLSTTPHQPASLANGGLDGWAPGDPCPVP